MHPLEIARQYFDAWNQRDPERIAAAFVEGGTYTDPSTHGDLTGEAIAAYAAGLFAAFPDLAFETTSLASCGEGQVAAQWIMRGTNSGSFAGAPPTGQSVELPGADFIAVDGDKVQSVRGYFDSRTVVRQLGLQVIVQPYALGPVSFGTSVRLSMGKRTKPGAFSVTMLEVRSEADAEQVRTYSRRILSDMAQMPGFISAVTGQNGNAMFTVTAWEGPEHPGQLLRGGTHKEALAAFFGPDLARGGSTSVWLPHHINPMWVRCASCNAMVAHEKLNGVCNCGSTLSDPPAYW